MYEVNIISENKNHKIIVNERTLSACMSKDYYCKLKNSIIIWEDEIVHECPFSYVKSLKLEPIGKALINKVENKYFEVVENETICNGIQAWRTAEGFYLTESEKALVLNRAETEVKIIDSLILSEIILSDFNSINLLQMMTVITRQTNEKICQIYITFMNMYKKLDDEFFTFTDFNGNEAVLYSDQGLS